MAKAKTNPFLEILTKSKYVLPEHLQILLELCDAIEKYTEGKVQAYALEGRLRLVPKGGRYPENAYLLFDYNGEGWPVTVYYGENAEKCRNAKQFRDALLKIISTQHTHDILSVLAMQVDD